MKAPTKMGKMGDRPRFSRKKTVVCPPFSFGRKITVVGAGYVGLANALLLAPQHAVTVLDIDADKVAQLQARQSPLADADMVAALADSALSLQATTDPALALAAAEFVIVATPTDWAADGQGFATASLEAVVESAVARCPRALVVIKSTVPRGLTQRLRQRLQSANIIFSPEFLREGRALHDCRYPSRIVVGDDSARGQAVADLFVRAAWAPEVPVLLTGADEAESIKLFANSFLALRVAFFNELDSFAAVHALDARQIIEGIGLDPRIGMHYNNPSFGYGGYCLPKDSQQLLSDFAGVPQNLLTAVVAANQTRKAFIVADIVRQRPAVVGIYRLAMKAGADNFRAAAIVDVLQALLAQGVAVRVFEPALPGPLFMGAPVVHDLAVFKAQVDLIVTNRRDAELQDVAAKVYSRDLFQVD